MRPTGICRFILFPLVSIATTACGGTDRSGDAGNNTLEKLTARSLGEQLIISNAEHLASAEYSSTDAAWGERLAMQCRACHSLEANGANMIGPALYGFFGKKSASVSGYPYSQALAEAEFVWTPRALDAWLAQPADFLPGNKMTFAGLGKAADRRAVVAYLLELTDDAVAN